MARKLKKFVIPTAGGVLVLSSLISLPMIFGGKTKVDSGYRYTVSEIKDKIFPVINEIEEKKPMKPFLEETVSKSKDFYRKDDTEDVQINSLIYYEKTYMPSTGILYSSDEKFEVVSSYDGKITKIGEDNILGKYVVIEHTNGYKTMYYSLSEVGVTEGAQVIKGDPIGLSGSNKIEGSLNNNILFETYHDGYLIDPEDFYNIDFNNQN